MDLLFKCVGFIVQMPEIWDKQADVYQALKARKGVETRLFVVPPYDAVRKVVGTEYQYNYFLNRYADAVKAIDEKGETVDLKSYGLDYVFYQRPYDHYLPASLRSSAVSAFARCCYVPYGFSGSDVFDEGNTNRGFFRNIYISFMESAYMQKKLKRKFPLSTALKVRRVEYLGYPSLEPYMNLSPAKEVRSVLWTPRWSYDSKMGGSHFLEFKNILFEIKRKYGEMRCSFRPHPLMFEEFKSKNLITDAEIAQFKEMMEKHDIFYDQEGDVFHAIEMADVLITDYSSIIINFFLTGKPIIYCSSQIELNETFAKMAEYMYIAKTEEDIYTYWEQLVQGNDYLYEKRKAFIASEFACHRNAGNRIADTLLKYR